MGAQAQPNQPTQVYYDPETSQYFSYGKAENSTPMANLLMGMGLPFVTVNGKPVSRERNYLSSPYSSSSADRFTPAYVPATYPEMNMLFPALNAGLAQGLISSTQPDGAMLGAGRFIAPQTTSQSKGK